ncbi:MAG: ABC transporter ATP-binding protein [Ruminococcus sp.]|nr:ABC transporter ATP-binding protein [Ruminococcus sp.]
MKNGKESNAAIMLRLLKLVAPLSGLMALAVLLGVMGFICAQFIPIGGVIAIAQGLGFDLRLSYRQIFTALGVMALLRAVFRCTEQYLGHYIAFRLLALIRDRVFKALRRLCPAKLEGRDKGDLIALITSDIELLEVFYAHTVSPICIAAVMSIIMTVFIGSVHPLLGALAAAAYLTVGAAVPILIFRISGNTAEEYRSRSGKLSALVLEDLRGLDETIQYNYSDRVLNKLNKRADDLSKLQRKMSRSTGFNKLVTNTAISVAGIAMLFAAIGLYTAGKISLGGVLTAVAAMMSSFGPTAALADLGSVLQNTLAAGRRVTDLIDEEPVTEDVIDGEDLSFEGAAVRDLSFSYSAGEENKVLEDLSLEIPRDSVIGIEGRSGSGKSTLLKLLMRFWSAKKDSVLISGKDIGSINTASLRSSECYMTQDTQLFHDTIANNIRIARADATREEIEEACKKASVHDFIMSLPEGYDSQAGELGEKLYEGEKQRIGLARAFLHGGPFMLLDEPTSSLDSLNEAVILKSISEEAGADRTVLIVSHRPSALRICDRTFTIENGRMS